ncbi:hypothetical protein Tco_0098844 [Tanacetum coccineum]
MANLPSPDHAADLPDDEPVHPEPAPIIPHQIPAQPEDDDEDDEDVEEDEVGGNDDNEEEIEVDEDDEDGGNDNEDEAEVINAYEEADPLNRSPPTSDEETEFAPPVVPIADADDKQIPPVIQFGYNFNVGESSSKNLLEGNIPVYGVGPMPYELKCVYKRVLRIDRQMFDRYRTEEKMAKKSKKDDLRMNRHEYDISALDTAVRENRSDNSKIKKFVLSLSKQFNELKEQNRRTERLSQWEASIRGRLPAQLRFQEEPPIHFVPRADDPYVMARDVALAAREHVDEDTTAPEDP